MSTEAQVAMLMLRLLIDKPKELQEVLDYLKNQVTLRKAVLDVGNTDDTTRDEILTEFEDKFGLVIDIFDEAPENGRHSLFAGGISNRMIGLPGGAKFKVG